MQQYQEGVVEAPFGDLSTYVSTAPQLGAPVRFPALRFYSSLLAGPRVLAVPQGRQRPV